MVAMPTPTSGAGGRTVLEVQQREHAARRWRALGRFLANAVIWVGAFTCLLPFIWMLSTSLKPATELFLDPPRWLPSRLEFANYAKMWQTANFGLFFRNSFTYALLATGFTLFFSSLAGYAFARLRFPGRDFIFFIMLTSLMIPSVVVMIPLFLMIKQAPLVGGNDIFGQGGSGLLNTFQGLLVPHVGSVFGMFLIKQFVQSIPYELDDAARIDGCSEFRIYWNIVMPLCKPALATLGIFTFQAAWNDFSWPLIATSGPKLMTIQLGLQVFRDTSGGEPDWALLMAGSVLAVIPVAIVFLLGQRYFTRGIAMTGLKG